MAMGFTMIILAICLIMLAFGLGNKDLLIRSTSSPFECGFDPVGSGRKDFSMWFFTIAIVFLIFDVEIALLLPLMIMSPYSEKIQWIYLSSFFLVVLILGTFLEWKSGALDWKV